MELLPLLDQVKDPAVALVLAWNVLELRRVRAHLLHLHREKEAHASRLARLEARAGID